MSLALYNNLNNHHNADPVTNVQLTDYDMVFLIFQLLRRYDIMRKTGKFISMGKRLYEYQKVKLDIEK